MGNASVVQAWASSGPQLRSVLRIVAALIFITSGTTKLFAFPTGVPPDGGTVPLVSQMGIGALLEMVGGTLMLLGLFTRPVAFVLSGEMAVAYFQFHFPVSFWPTVNQGFRPFSTASSGCTSRPQAPDPGAWTRSEAGSLPTPRAEKDQK